MSGNRMKNARCYGKNTVAPRKEKSFIKKFFEGNESSDSSLFGKSSEDVLQKDSLEEKYDEVILQSPLLFENIADKSLSLETESFSRKQQTKATNVLPKRKKKVKQKKNIKKKPKQVFYYTNKYKSLQPRWSEIDKHELTIEREGTNKLYSSVASRYQSNQNRILRKKQSKHIRTQAESNLLGKMKNIQRTNQQKLSSSKKDTLDRSSDLFIPIKGMKSFKKYVSHIQREDSHNLTQKHDKDLSACVTSELSKKFNESMKLGNFSVAPDHTLYFNKDLYTERETSLHHRSPVSVTKREELEVLRISGTEKLNTSHNFMLLSTKSNELSLCAKERSFNLNKSTSKKLNSGAATHISHASIHPERTSALKFVTSTPIVPKSKKNLYSANIGSIHKDFKNHSRLSAFYLSPGILYSDKHIENCLNICEEGGHKNGFPLSTSNKLRLSLEKEVHPDFYRSNKSMTLPPQEHTQSSNNSLHSIKNRSSINVSTHKHNEPLPQESVESTKIKLLELCNQDCFADFADIYDWKKSKVKKIGEGSYGEVFMLTKGKLSCVLKIIPISCENTANDCCLGLANVVSEVKISKCLSDLRSNKRNQTKNFIKLNRVSVACGIYPSVLLDAWDNYSETKSSYNERPDNYDGNQMFVLLELEYGGKDMSAFVLRNAIEAESVLKQVAITLAVAEEEYVFEHRDLHLGNILIQRNRKKSVSYKLRGNDISFECHGIQVTLIDFTLSRLHEDGFIYFNDLANEISLFEQSGDYQFDVYKSMKRVLENQWQECCLYSNVLWLKFLCRKFKDFEYSRPSSLAHKKGLKAIDLFNDQLTSCNSATGCLAKCGITPLYFERSNTDSELTKRSILISRNSSQKPKLSICR